MHHAMARTAAEIVWLQCLVTDVGVAICTSTANRCDNWSAILKVGNLVIF